MQRRLRYVTGAPGALATACAALVLMVAGCGDDEAAPAGPAASATTGSGGAASASSSSTGGAGAGEPVESLHLVGRFDDKDPDALGFSWPGTSIGAHLDGTSVSVELEGYAGTFFQVLVDGKPTSVFQTKAGVATYPVAEGLAAGEHDIAIYRRTESFTGVVSFHEFVPGPDSKLVDSPSPFVHRIEFIGDAMTCGYGIEGADAECHFTGDTESAYSTYAGIVARNEKAAAHIIAYSGKGVFQNTGGDKMDPMPALYLRTLGGDPASTWDFSKWTAEAVVVNLGTHDFSAPITHDEFVDAYADLLKTIRSKYARAMIFAIGWISWGGDKSIWVKDALAKVADPNTHYVEFTIDPADGYGCDYHPGKVMNEKLGALLTTEIEQALGW